MNSERRFGFIITFLLCLANASANKITAADTRNSKISATLNFSIPSGAIRGEFEIHSSVSGELIERRFFESGKVRVQLPAGKYKVRTRGLDRREVPGPWSEFSEFMVKPKPEPQLPSQLAQSKTEVPQPEKPLPQLPRVVLESQSGSLLRMKPEPTPDLKTSLPVTTIVKVKIEFRKWESSDWVNLGDFESAEWREFVLPASNPGEYRLRAILHAKQWLDSEESMINLVIKPSSSEVMSIGSELRKPL